MVFLVEILKLLVEGDSAGNWLITKFIMALIGGVCAYIIKHSFYYKDGETKIDFWWKGFWFVIISSLGGVIILGPQTAGNAFVAGLLGWSAIAKVLKQGNEGASSEQFSEDTLTKEQIQVLQNQGDNNE